MSETKDKILEAANILFAKYGFDGASIREIAKEAGVNLGAINYHFESKENLFCELILSIKNFVDQELEELLKTKVFTFKEFLLAFYDKFSEFGDGVSNSFKLMINDSISPEVFEKYNMERNFTPPGTTILFRVMDQEFGERMAPFAKIWVIKQIFTIIVHYVVMGNSSIGRYHLHNFPVEQVKHQIHAMLEHTINALVEYALNNKEKFDELNLGCSVVKS